MKSTKSESKKVFEWNIVSEQPAPISQAETYLHEHTYCSQCGDELMYTHVTDFRFLEVKEEAECLSCGIRHKKNHHVLQ